jgi:CHAT domain-containing protein/Tfp pilus assembly protein PilF
MRSHLFLTLLTYAIFSLQSPQAYAQADNPLAEAQKMDGQCLEFKTAGSYDKALDPCQRALEIREKTLDGEHVAVAVSLNNLAELYRLRGEYDKALPHQLRALTILEKKVGIENLDVATSLNNLAQVYVAKADYEKAEPLYVRALAILEKGFVGERLAIANLQNNLAQLYVAKGEYEKAEPLYLSSLAARKSVLGNQHFEVAISLNNLAVLYQEKGDYGKAKPLYQQAVAIIEKVLGKDHPTLANLLSNLAVVEEYKGDYADAEPLYQRALEIRNKALGSEHPLVATSLGSLAGLYMSKGDAAKAEPLYQRALEIDEKALGSEHPNVAVDLNNLAEMYCMNGDYQRAEPRYLRALAIIEKVHGSEHPLVATFLNNLAALYQAKGESEKAEPLYRRALAIREKRFGNEHPLVAASLNNLGMWYSAKGDYARADLLYQRALEILEKTLGDDHPRVATVLNNLAGLHEAKGDYPRALEFLIRGQEIRESNLSAILATGSEKQKQLYLDTLSGDTDSAVSLHIRSAPANVQAARFALTTILQRKGRALDAMTDQIAGLRRRAASEDLKLLDTLGAAQSQLANLQLSSDTRLSPADRRRRAAELETEIERLQNDIGRRNAEFRARAHPVTLEAVRRAIPPDAALVEIFAYQPLNVKAKTVDQRYDKARYVAYVLKPTDTEPQFVDLGETGKLDSDLKLWRAALLNPHRTDVRALGRSVDERLMRPIRKLLGGTKRLFISPDGALNLIPFAALVDENNQYLLKTYSFNYLTSGRDLLRLQITTENRPGAVIFANPTYNLTGQPVAACQGSNPGRGNRFDAQDADRPTLPSAMAARGIDFSKICYPPLRGTAQEARLISTVLPRATVVTGKRATEAAIKELNSPPILHVATHGFFLPDQTQNLNADAAVGVTTAPVQSPLLRSGLIMAGANQKSSGMGEDGVLTAAEAAGLNLWGTKLVVLSACETGLGEVVNGAGVYGLRRALLLAGSETQVISLWQVDDAATRDLMGDYYSRLQRGEGRTEAMRQGQLKMLRGGNRRRIRTERLPTQPNATSARHAHPYYWAAFILSGDWRSINKKEQ